MNLFSNNCNIVVILLLVILIFILFLWSFGYFEYYGTLYQLKENPQPTTQEDRELERRLKALQGN